MKTIAMVLALGVSTAYAGQMTGTIGYSSLGQTRSDGSALPAGSSASVGPAATVELTANDYPATDTPGFRLSTYVRQTVSGDAASGDMTAQASTTMAGEVTSTIEWHDSLVNLSGSRQNYLMEVALTDASAGVGGWTRDYTQRFNTSSFEASIQVNGATVWETGYQVSFNGGITPVLTHWGASLGDVTFETNDGGPQKFELARSSNGHVSLDSYLGNVNLGTFADGESFSVTYTLRARASFIDPASCFYECGGAGAGISDPFSINGSGAPRITAFEATAAVPEPSQYLLFLSGLVAMALVIRRRSRNSH